MDGDGLIDFLKNSLAIKLRIGMPKKERPHYSDSEFYPIYIH